ncbi:glycosyltransferase [Poriferisphaera corsica]|uniref:glycosyltransferase n=1 Tax=Poriferisphaera corsica TaxID=2528020 RepID=UPI00190C8895|nr:glycosyltransferase [Poriferisphaera corsica]
MLHQLQFAGAEVLAAGLARELKHRWAFTFICLDGIGQLGEQLQSEGFEVIELGRKPGIDMRVAKKIRKLTLEHKIDLLHAHQYTPFFYASASRGLFRSTPPIIFTEHGRNYPDIASTKRLIANRFLLRKHDQVTAVGQFIRRALIENEGIRYKHIDVIYNGINPDQFAGSNRSEARNKLNLQPQDLVIMQVARFHPVKDHETSIRAFKQVLEQEPNAKLILIGDGELKPRMEQLAEELGIKHRIQFEGVREDVDQVLAAADVFTLSSLSEGISVTLLEACAANKPIAATDVGGNAEIVKHDTTGLLAPRQDHKQLANHILRLLQSEKLRSRMGQAGNEHLRQNFTQQAMHRAYEAVYDITLNPSE